MDYRKLGSSGLSVSTIGMGTMTFGGQSSESDAFRQLDLAYDVGITLFDTAENYPTPFSPSTQGESEAVLGRWIASRKVRDKVVVATKVAAFGGFAYLRGEDRRLDRGNIRAAIEASLRRLNTDYIDLYQTHWPERPIALAARPRIVNMPDRSDAIPIFETLAALDELVSAGLVRAVGVCNESAWGVMRHLAIAAETGRARIASVQNGYNLLDRSLELGLAECALREQVSLIAYSPLATGALTGKYGSVPAVIEGTRSSYVPDYLNRLSPNRIAAIQAYAAIATAHGLSLAHMALAFVRQQPFVGSVLMAASSAAQLEANIGAIDVMLSKDVIKQINAVHDERPNPL